MQSTKDKKGQVSFGNITGAAVAIGILIVVVTVFAILITSLDDSIAGITTTITNDTEASVATNVSFQLDHSSNGIRGYALDTTSVVVINATDDQTIENGNFTFFSNGTVDMITIEFTGAGYNFSYTYTGDTSAGQNTTANGLTFFTNLTSQVGLLGTILILVLIVVIIISAFAFGGRREGSL